MIPLALAPVKLWENNQFFLPITKAFTLRSALLAETFLKNWHKREAYVHAFVDQDAVVQIHTPTRAVWGAGRPANRRYIQVELCEGRNFNEFARSVNNDAIYVAYLLHKYQLKPS